MKLEDKIIRSVYVMETKKMSASFIIRLFLATLSAVTAFLMIQILGEALATEHTFNVLSIFNDDVEIIRSYLGDIAGVIFQETPKGLLAAIVVAVSVVLVIILTFIFNFGKMRHKLAAIINYWQHH